MLIDNNSSVIYKFICRSDVDSRQNGLIVGDMDQLAFFRRYLQENGVKFTHFFTSSRAVNRIGHRRLLRMKESETDITNEREQKA